MNVTFSHSYTDDVTGAIYQVYRVRDDIDGEPWEPLRPTAMRGRRRRPVGRSGRGGSVWAERMAPPCAGRGLPDGVNYDAIGRLAVEFGESLMERALGQLNEFLDKVSHITGIATAPRPATVTADQPPAANGPQA